jgi:2-polyprenyl-3-methyl-5-hydroxy-6-metoxy-1,4-benzoquinol methylase
MTTTTPDPQQSSMGRSIGFWENRHCDLPHSLAGPDLSSDDAGSVAFDALRIGRLIEILGTFAEPAAPMRILDAGCGTGWVTRALASFGHQVDGVDSAATAVSACCAQAGTHGRDSYALARLDTWAPPYLYDAVVSLDVLVQIMEESVWAASLVNLASLVRFGGCLVLSEHDLANDRVPGDYQMTRVREDHVQLLAAEGLMHRSFQPCEFRCKNAGFHVFDRIT